jgi:Nucleoside-diphosphate-sugar pyrophosphorylase involved in lipopolysaccharide biosynthesis/translation initiation factor 2B, gamma/epsilon subunits (eIF-2Bgamma/eIF-2Bepsilon)
VQNPKLLVTISTARPKSRFGVVSMQQNNLVDEFIEKPIGNELVNIGFMVCTSQIFDHLHPGEALEEGPLRRIANKRLLAGCYHPGFWQPVDTVRELSELNKMWEQGLTPWVIEKNNA